MKEIITVQELEEIKEKIESKKTERDKAKGTIEKIEGDWKEEFNFSTVEEAQEKAKQLQSDIDKTNERLEKLTIKLERVTNWEELE